MNNKEIKRQRLVLKLKKTSGELLPTLSFKPEE